MDMGRREGPYIKIVEQPASKALRFRYECEGRSAGSIPGVSSTQENKTYPTIQICNYRGRAVVVVSCVTKDQPYRPHPHNLVGRDGCKKGVCTVEVHNEGMTQSFDHLGIQCVKKKDIEEALKAREEIRVDPFRTGFSHRSQPGSIDLNAVRLCFQAFLEDEPGKFKLALMPVVSEIIYDKKALCDLAICKLSHCSASVAGGQEVILLCEKVAKEDISVRLFEEKNGQVVWEDLGEFTPTQVHKQVAISFKTPRYHTLQVEAPVKVSIQLRRPSDGETSEALPFLLTPLDSGRPAFWSLRRCKADYQSFSTILTADAKLLAKMNTVNSANVPVISLDSPPIETRVEDQSTQNTNNNVETAAEPVQATEITSGWESQNKDSNILAESPELYSPETEQFLSHISVEDKISQSIPVEILDNNNSGFDNNTHTLADNYSSKLDLEGNEKFDNVNEMLESAVHQGFDDLMEEVDDFNDMMTEDLTQCDMGGSNNEGIYTSFQLAMRNPFEVNEYNTSGYEDVVPPRPSAAKPVIRSEVEDIPREITDEMLPPLPPKRIRKSPPSKNLPPVPEGKKLNIFQKLFSSKRKEKDKSRKNSISSMDSKKFVIEKKLPDENVEPDDVTLTEAEHYALYTTLAPHATASEFDETSFYYSPVEGHSQTVK